MNMGGCTMNLEEVMRELEELGKERSKKMYMSNGACEPVFGVATGAMKPMSKKIRKDQELAEQLYATGNYDAMYFAGVIADPARMTEADFERWIDAAYFYMISDFVVAVTLSESDIAQTVADKWIASGDELKQSAGWSCYCWLLGTRKDEEFEAKKLDGLLDLVLKTIHAAPERAQYSMANFVYTTAVSYGPLHERALATAEAMAPVEVGQGTPKSKVLQTSENIRKAADRGRIVFKRKHVRC